MDTCLTASCSNDFDAMVFTETWLSPDFYDNEFFSESLIVLRHDRDIFGSNRSRGGGVLMAINSKHSVIPLDVSSIRNVSPLVNIVACKCLLEFKSVVLIAVYLTPDLHITVIEDFFNNLEELVSFNNTILIGDFNFPNIINTTSNDSKSRICRDFLAVTNLHQCNNIPNMYNKYLDLVLSNILPTVSKVDQPIFPEESHHPALLISVHTEYREPNFKFPCNSGNKQYNFKRAPLLELYMLVANTDWVGECKIIDDVDQSLESFYTQLYSILDSIVPKYKNNSKTYPVWFTQEIKANIKRKDQFLSKYKKCGLGIYRDQYTQLRSLIKSKIKQAYKAYLLKLSENIKYNTNDFWKFVNSKRKGSRLPNTMFLDNEDITTPQSIVDAFAYHFSSFFTTPGAVSTENSIKFQNTFSNFHSVTLPEVKEAIKSLKGNLTAGHDQIPTFLIKDCAFYLAPVIQSLFNLILRTATFPKLWKISKITPIWKSGSKSDIKNYRPVALLSNFSKIFEVIIHKRLNSMISSSISEHQHGFRSGRSTTTNLVQICQYISNALDLRQQVDVIYTDLSRAFDSINHVQLISKLNYIGVDPSLSLLINSYLIDRSFYVSYNSFNSTTQPCPSGVPQGSILGPLLFVIFINDLLVSISCPVLAYADDIKIFLRINSSQDCIRLQKSLVLIDSWCKTNNIAINSSKCKTLRFSRCHNDIIYNYSIDSVTLESVSEFKDLGILFDKSLSFKQHINMVSTSSLRLWGFVLRTCKDYTSIDCIKMLYYALVRSKLEYASIVWNPFYKGDILQIEKVQRRFLKYVYFKNYGEYPTRGIDYEVLLTSTMHDSLHYRRLLNGVKFIYSLVHNKIKCRPILSLLNICDRRTSTRKPLLFTNVRAHTNVQLKSPIYTMCHNINNICNDCDIYSVKFDIIAYYFRNYYQQHSTIFV